MNRITFLMSILALSLASVFSLAGEPQPKASDNASPPRKAAQPQPNGVLVLTGSEPYSSGTVVDSVDWSVADRLKAPKEERVKVLTELVEEKTAQYRVGTSDVASVWSAENELCNALLDSTDEPQKRIAVLTKQVERATDFLKTTQGRFEAGTATHSDVLWAKSLCLDIKIKLLLAPSKKGPLIKTTQGGDATAANEEYKIISARDEKLESTLNALAKQGWKVRTTAAEGYLIILAR